MLSRFRMYTSCIVQGIHLFPTNSGQEQEIIEHPSSCYVIGRSGTGKTTTMLFKMLGIQRIWQQYPDMGPRPRQIFITQSRVLASKVKDDFAQLMSSHEAAACSPRELRMRERDAEQEMELVDQDDNKQWRSDLPEKFSELQDEHFPLFITYDRVRIPLPLKHPISPFYEQLCAMLQNDMIQGYHNDGSIIPKAHSLEDGAASPATPASPQSSGLRAGSEILSSSDYMQQPRTSFVSYSVFLASYWDHFPQTLTRGLGEKQRFMYDLSWKFAP